MNFQFDLMLCSTAAYSCCIVGLTSSAYAFRVFAVVLTPTRELAVQISEQFGALGALMGLRHTVVIGGVGVLEQSLELAGELSDFATPGRRDLPIPLAALGACFCWTFGITVYTIPGGGGIIVS